MISFSNTYLCYVCKDAIIQCKLNILFNVLLFVGVYVVNLK